jgi:uncharacterized spore protein YtfJ
MEHVQELLKTVNEKLASLGDARAVVGQPMKLGEVTLVPVSRIGVGFGGGGGEGEGDQELHAALHGRKSKVELKGKGQGTGGGAGAGAKARPVAVIAFTPEGVQILPVPDRKNALERLVEKLPEWIERFSDKVGRHGS